MAEDKRTLGLSDANRATLDVLVEQMGFSRDYDAAKFALAFAISHGAKPGTVEGSGTIWNVGSFDESGDLRSLVLSLYPDTLQPYRAIESLMNIGFEMLRGVLASNPGISLTELMKSGSA